MPDRIVWIFYVLYEKVQKHVENKWTEVWVEMIFAQTGCVIITMKKWCGGSGIPQAKQLFFHQNFQSSSAFRQERVQ